MIIRPANKNDLPVLLEFEQEIVKAERPFNSTMKDGEIHFYDLLQLIEVKKLRSWLRRSTMKLSVRAMPLSNKK